MYVLDIKKKKRSVCVTTNTRKVQTTWFIRTRYQTSLLNVSFTSSTKVTACLLLHHSRSEYFDNLLNGRTLAYLCLCVCPGCAFIRSRCRTLVARSAKVQHWSEWHWGPGKRWSCLTTSKRKVWRAERPIIHEATHWMVPPKPRH